MFQGLTFQDLEILQTLDQTHEGFTRVYLARLNSQIVVCKAIQKSYFKDQKSVQHIKNEKEVLKHFTKLKNPNINHLLSTFQDNQRIYMILQVVEGLPLHKLLKMVGAFTEEFGLLILGQIGQIMNDFHCQGYVYRDIKASNFMVNNQGKITMIDLGKAKRIQRQKTFTICGTSHAMPPQVYKKSGYSYQFDYYSFGILVYELLVGIPPFGYGNTNPNIIQDMNKGLTQQILSKLRNQKAADLVSKLVCQENKRIGKKRGFEEILEHEYFADLQKPILSPSPLKGKEHYECYSTFISQINDLGIQYSKYEKILEDDPFYKFLE